MSVFMLSCYLKIQPLPNNILEFNVITVHEGNIRRPIAVVVHRQFCIEFSMRVGTWDGAHASPLRCTFVRIEEAK